MERAIVKVVNQSATEELVVTRDTPYLQTVVDAGAHEAFLAVDGAVLAVASGIPQEDWEGEPEPDRTHWVKVEGVVSQVVVERTVGENDNLPMPDVLDPGDSVERDLGESGGCVTVRLR